VHDDNHFSHMCSLHLDFVRRQHVLLHDERDVPSISGAERSELPSRMGGLLTTDV
jgi:hypothetical protein